MSSSSRSGRHVAMRQAALAILILVSACALVVGGCATRARGCAPACDPCAAAPACDPCATAPTAEPLGDRPPEAKAGEAWCRVWVPPVSRTVVEQVCVSPAQKKKIAIPAEYGTRPKLVCVAPAKVQEVVQPGVWRTETKDVLVCPEREVYRRVQCAPSNLGPCEQQCECWVTEKVPPVFRTTCEPVCVAPPKKTVKFSPAQYKSVEERFLVRPARCEEICEPARYETRTREVCVQPGRWEWRRNTDCEVPQEAPLPALEVEMVDSDPSGAEKGVFALGSAVRYNLVVRSDVGSEAMPNLRVVFTLPEQLEFVSGGGAGLTVTGSGRSATTTVFPLALHQEVRVHILARVTAVPPTSYVQTTASVQTEQGDELARETESTTLTDGGN